jgi:hypothetical protein
MSQAYSNGAIITDGAPPSASADAPLISTDSKEAGLWLWQGDAPAPSSLPRPKSSDRQILHRIVHAGGWAGWIALPIGLALTFIAISAVRHPDKPVSADTPGAASLVASSTVTPPSVSVPPAQLTESRSDQAQLPALPTAQILTPGPEPRTAEWHLQRKSSRPTRKTNASHVHRAPPIPRPGVLTPPLTWHGGGY